MGTPFPFPVTVSFLLVQTAEAGKGSAYWENSPQYRNRAFSRFRQTESPTLRRMAQVSGSSDGGVRPERFHSSGIISTAQG